jgi:A/G-specific adenine glycosylase
VTRSRRLRVPTALRRTFQRRLLAWYRRHRRNLPWRRTRDPYHILVSEIMLQQTQVDRVIPKYQEWLAKYRSRVSVPTPRGRC